MQDRKDGREEAGGRAMRRAEKRGGSRAWTRGETREEGGHGGGPNRLIHICVCSRVATIKSTFTSPRVLLMWDDVVDICTRALKGHNSQRIRRSGY